MTTLAQQIFVGRISNRRQQSVQSVANVWVMVSVQQGLLNNHQTHRRTDILYVVVQCGFDQQAPKILDGLPRLPLLFQPLVEGDFLQLWLAALGEPDADQRPQYPHFFPKAKMGVGQE